MMAHRLRCHHHLYPCQQNEQKRTRGEQAAAMKIVPVATLLML